MRALTAEECPKLPGSRHRLAIDHCALAVGYGRTVAKRRLAKSEIYGASRLAVVVAAARFDEGRGVQFKSFLQHYVRKYVQLQIYSYLAVHVPTNTFGDLKRRGASADDRTGRQAAAAWHPRRLDSIDPETGRGYWEHALAPDPEPCPAPDEVALLASALGRLTDRERDILRMVYGLGGGEPMSLAAVGRAIGVTRERVRQIHERAMANLRIILDISSFYPEGS